MKERNLLEELQKLQSYKKSKQFYASRLGVSLEELDELYKELRNESEIEEDFSDVSQKFNMEKGTAEFTSVTSTARSLKELIRDHKIDATKYKVSSYWSKQKGDKFYHSLFLTLIKLDTDIISQKDIILKEIMESSIHIPFVKDNTKSRIKYAYEINIPDVHFGKLSWKDESGEDYDLAIAEKRYEEAIQNLLSLVNTEDIEEIIFPIGNDMINIDSRRNETFAGTGQDSDSRFFKIVQVVKSILIRNINSLSLIAPVKVITISGNHDPETMFMLGEILSAYYHNNRNVSVDNSPKQRKYFQYGLNGFQYTHGNEEKHTDLGLIFATEQTKLWADTQFRFCKLGHFHKNKTISYLSVDEHQGFQVQILPSLSSSDAWHNSKGYMAKKQAKGFLYHKNKGQVAEYTFSV